MADRLTQREWEDAVGLRKEKGISGTGLTNEQVMLGLKEVLDKLEIKPIAAAWACLVLAAYLLRRTGKFMPYDFSTKAIDAWRAGMEVKL